ncbi:MAG: LacI family DNA-binding transcriptional regulator [Bacillota bacterium]
MYCQSGGYLVPVTVKDVAREAGVSICSVSRVLNGTHRKSK